MARLTPEEVARMNALLDEQKARLGDINDMTSMQAERYKVIQTIQKQANDALEQGLTSTEQKYQDLYNIQESLVDEAKELTDEATKLQVMLDSHVSTKEDSIKLSQEDLETIIARKEEIESELETLGEINRQTENRIKHETRLESLADSYLETFFGIREEQTGFVGALQESVQSGNSLGSALTDVAKGVLDGMRAGVSLNTVLFSIAGKIQESTVAMVVNTDEALANFNEMTTAGGELNKTIIESSFDTREMGIAMGQTVQAARELYENMSGFTELTTEAQGEMLTLAAGMEKAGVSARDTAEIFDTAMKGFGMTTGEATDLSKELLATAQALNVPAGKLAKDFNAAMGELAKHGPKGVEVFKGLAAQAKAAGVEMNTLLGIAGQFDTIEGAANATSRLNAILGSNINTMEMLNATEEDRIALLQQAVNATGRSFDEMDRFEKQAIASAAGISDMSEAAKLFNAETAAFGSAADSMNEVGAAQADMAAATEAATSIGEKVTLLFESMAVAILPAMQLLNFFLEILLSIVSPIMGFANVVINSLIDPLKEFAGIIVDFVIPPLKGFGMALAAIVAAFVIYEGALIAVQGVQTVYAMFTAGTLIPTIMAKASAMYLATLPFIIMAAKIAAVIAVGYLLYETFNFLIEGAMKLGSAIIDAFTGSFDGLYDIFVQPFVDAWDAITGFFGFASPSKAAEGLGVGIVDGMVNGLSNIVDLVMAPIQMVMDAMFNLFGSALSNIVDLVIAPIQMVVDAMFNLFGSVFSNIADLVIAPFQMVVDAMSSLFSMDNLMFIADGITQVVDFFVNIIVTTLDEIGAAIVRFGESITTFFSTVFGPIIDFFSPVIAVMKNIFNTARMGANAVVGVLNGINFTVPDWVPIIGGEQFGFNISAIPMLEEGGFIDKEGAAYLHEGEKVIPAAEVSALDEAATAALDFMANPIEAAGGLVGGLVQSVLGTDEVVAAIKENTAAIRSLAGAGAAGPGGESTIVLELNERQLGKAVTNGLNKKNQITLA